MHATQQLRRMARIRNGSDHSGVQDDFGAYPVYGSGGEFTRANSPLYSGPAVLLGRKGTIDKPILVDGEFWTVDTMFCAQPYTGVDPTFLYYACTTIPFDLLSTSTALPSMTQGDLNAARLSCPSYEVQQETVRFLDRETVKIDALIAKQEQLVATLREDRAATITQAVTKGLAPDVEMKDAEVDWVDAIPASWSMTPFLRCMQGRVDYRGATPKKVDAGVLLITARNVRPGLIDYTASEEYVAPEEYADIMRRGIPDIDDLLFTMEAPLGYVALVDRTDIGLAQRIIKFRADRDAAMPRFLMYAIMSDGFQFQLTARATGSTALGLKASKLSELRVALPPIDEQLRISDFLGHRCAQIDALIAKSTEMIETLRKYRSALITDAVTGKIDVRGMS